MKIPQLGCLSILLAALLTANYCVALDKPEVVIFATGGTIAGSGETSTSATYAAAKVPVDQLLNAVPQIKEIANVRGEQVVQIASQAMTNEVWLKLAHQVNEALQQESVSGAVITHGTDTMEETAYFLDLVLQTNKPVVLVGSMRPSTSLSADGALNLYNAVAVAANEASKNYGVLVAMNDSLFSARDVTKSNTTAVDTFKSPRKGPIGKVEYGAITFFQAPRTRNPSPFTIVDLKTLPQVDIVYGYANASPIPINALVKAGSKGIVHAGVGNGNLFPAVEQALIEARKQNVVIVRSSRVGSGQVLRNAEVKDDEHDFVVANDLNPQKARIFLMLALEKKMSTQDIQALFDNL